MYIFLDVIKTPEIQKFDKVIHKFKDFINIIQHNEIEFLSLGYEVDDKVNGLDVLWYLREKNIEIPFINIHTHNTAARNTMRLMIKKHMKNTFITFMRDI